MKFKPLSGNEPVTLKEPHRRATVLFVWASWCKPCREAAEMLSEMTDELRGQGAEVVGLTTESPADGAAPLDFATLKSLRFRSGWVEREVALLLLGEKPSLPLILVFNQDGYITTRFKGYSSVVHLHLRRAVKAVGESAPFDPAVTRLPHGYSGTDLDGLVRSLEARKKKLLKDEFETTAQHQERVRAEESQPVYGSLTRDSLMAVVIPASASYDADQETMTVKATVPEQLESLTFRERGELNYGTKVKMDIPTARRAKTELRALVIFKLTPPYVAEDRLTAAAREVWFFDNATGEVVGKNMKKDAPAPDPVLGEITRLIEAGENNEALTKLREVVMAQPMNAGAYLLMGKVYRKRGETSAAVGQFKTAIFWDSARTLVEPHVLLAQIYFEQGDRAQALTYVRSALQIDPSNREALSLRSRLEPAFK